VGGTKGRKASTARQTQVTGPSAAREGAAAEEVLIFEDTFEELDMDVWAHDITMSGGGNWWVWCAGWFEGLAGAGAGCGGRGRDEP